MNVGNGTGAAKGLTAAAAAGNSMAPLVWGAFVPTEFMPRGTPSRGGGGARTIKLSLSEQEAARNSGQTYEEYARLMERERKAGNIGPRRLN